MSVLKIFISVFPFQWMTAGRGIVHSEMPHSNGDNTGLQLWVNLARADKMVEPAYQELRHDQIPQRSEGGVSVKVIAGESMGAKVRKQGFGTGLALRFIATRVMGPLKFALGFHFCVTTSYVIESGNQFEFRRVAKT